MNCSKGFVRLFFALLVAAVFSQTVFAALITTGEVFPVDPSTWDPSTTAYVGIGGTGSVVADGGTSIASRRGYLGYGPGSTGEVMIDGAGSTWSSSGLKVGNYGNGTLNVTGGGAVSNSGHGYIGFESGSIGTVTVDGAGSTLTNYNMINSKLTVGYHGNGTLDITNGAMVSSKIVKIGYYSGSIGTASINGSGSTLNTEADILVGRYGNGTLNITDGATVTNSTGQIGSESGSTGTVNVDGAGSIWNNNTLLNIGLYGAGTLNVIDGAMVTVRNDTIVSFADGSLGSINFYNGTLSTGSLLCALGDITGTGDINTHGLVSDVNLVFDSTHGLNQTLNINDNPGQNITLNLDSNSPGSMGAGYAGVGSMSISEGKVIQSTSGYIGYKSGSTGTVNVDGTGSKWNNYSSLVVGHNGAGTLDITDGGAVSNRQGCIGGMSGSTGTVTVDGADSTWMNSDDLLVGSRGNATLNITDGGLVSVVGELMIDYDGDGDSFVNMATGGMLALEGDADDSIGQFLGLVGGTDAIRYWDGGAWAHISGATAGSDYTLEYLTDGQLSGFTMLTVMTAVPEPSTIVLILVGLGALLVVRRRR
jgi:T5SS/PEP-CTERM-associated repeat protein